MLAPLKQAMAEAVAKAVNILVKLLAKFVPLAVLKILMAALDQILEIFCVPVPAWLGLVNSALGDISSFTNGLVNSIVDKVTNQIDNITNRLIVLSIVC